VYERHPLAEITADAPKWETKLLAVSIRERGLESPIILYEGKILDGFNRYIACATIGYLPTFTDYDGDDPIGLLLQNNVNKLATSVVARALIAEKAVSLPRTLKLPMDAVIYSIEQATEAVGVSRYTITALRVVLRHGTPQEIAAMTAGQVGIDPLSRVIRQRVGPSGNKRGKQPKLMEVGGNRKRHENMKMSAVIWGDLRDAITKLTGLPSPPEVAQLISRNPPASRALNEKLNRGLEWLKEFANAWDDIQNEKNKARAGDDNTGGGGGSSGAQHLQSPTESEPRREDCAADHRR
jgi:hypothetical protein